MSNRKAAKVFPALLVAVISVHIYAFKVKPSITNWQTETSVVPVVVKPARRRVLNRETIKNELSIENYRNCIKSMGEGEGGGGAMADLRASMTYRERIFCTVALCPYGKVPGSAQCACAPNEAMWKR